jgi:hypothetical protein
MLRQEVLDAMEMCYPDDNMEVDFVEEVEDWMDIWQIPSMFG